MINQLKTFVDFFFDKKQGVPFLIHFSDMKAKSECFVL